MRRRALPWTALLLACAGLVWVPLALAQEVSLEPPDERGEGAALEEAEHASGVYTGVKPGGNEAPAVAVKPGATPATVTWPGFQMKPDGSSRVFLQTSVPVATTGSVQQRTFVIDLGDAPIAGDTNRFPLLTQHFNTPVTRVELKRANKRTTLVLTLRADVQPQVSSDKAQSGFFFLYVDFPAGNFLAAAAAAAPAASPPADGTTFEAPPAPPSHLEGEVAVGASAGGGVKASAAADAELPPGMAKPKAKAKTSGKAKLGF